MVRGRNTPIMCLMGEGAARWLSANAIHPGHGSRISYPRGCGGNSGGVWCCSDMKRTSKEGTHDAHMLWDVAEAGGRRGQGKF
jgi:hypothetical protein